MMKLIFEKQIVDAVVVVVVSDVMLRSSLPAGQH